MIENKADINIRDPSGQTAFGMTYLTGAKDVQSLLLDLKADMGDPKSYNIRTRPLDFDE